MHEEPGWPDIHVEPGEVWGLLVLVPHDDGDWPQKSKVGKGMKGYWSVSPGQVLPVLYGTGF